MLQGNYVVQSEHCRDLDDYCLFDLGDDSWLAPITEPGTEFRVTQYDPDKLRDNHRPGVHRYLVAREVVDADVILSLPKLKTHKKAGITGALKNMIGINGFKEYLPHHRKGSPKAGGDCYKSASWLKALAEDWLDRANRSRATSLRFLHFNAAAVANKIDMMLRAGDSNIDGSWCGNDTVWRTCLDLQRIVHYGTRNGKIASARQREVITVTDAIIAGEGDGPLFPSPVPLGIMTFGDDVAALEWVHARLMGMDPKTHSPGYPCIHPHRMAADQHLPSRHSRLCERRSAERTDQRLAIRSGVFYTERLEGRLRKRRFRLVSPANARLRRWATATRRLTHELK